MSERIHSVQRVKQAAENIGEKIDAFDRSPKARRAVWTAYTIGVLGTVAYWIASAPTVIAGH